MEEDREEDRAVQEDDTSGATTKVAAKIAQHPKIRWRRMVLAEENSIQ